MRSAIALVVASILVASALAPGRLSAVPVAQASTQDNLPPIGRSLFDFLIADPNDTDARAQVPFPFERLVAHLAARGAAERSGVRQVLIPLGRSLQRAVAGPNFFSNPRVVVAFDSDRASDDGVLLKDRLYLGYQAAAEVVEVISYNEQAARFEFQIVREYRADSTPDVRYANRALCVACHQHEVPIFSRRLWSETNANPQVAALLARNASAFHGVPAIGGVDITQAIDDATDRASLFATWQRLWREGCAGESARRCRADALLLSVADALGIRSPVEPEATRLHQALDDAWLHSWPNGLELAQPDIPNRDPLKGLQRRNGTLPVGHRSANSLDDFTTALMRSNAIETSLEPLEKRPAAGLLQRDDPQRDRRFVQGLAGFFAADDLRAIDTQLELAQKKLNHKDLSNDQQVIALQCNFSRRARTDTSSRISARCTGAGDAHLEGRFYLDSNRVTRARIDRLRLDRTALNHLTLASLSLSSLSNGKRLQATPRRQSGLRTYLDDGRVVTGIDITWRNIDLSETSFVGEAAISTLPAIELIRKAVSEVLAPNMGAQQDAFATGAFQRAVVIQQLLEALGAKKRHWCCLDTASLPPAKTDETTASGVNIVSSAHATFIEHCGQCHRTDHSSPPNFLHGGDSDIKTQVAQCAERIHYRLQMWHRDGPGNAKTPMPPASILASRHIKESDWRTSAALLTLSAHVRSLIENEPGVGAGRAERVLEQDYATLRPCLASSTAALHARKP